MKYSAEEVMQYVKEEDVQFIRLAFCDIFGDLDSRTVQIGSQCIPRDTRNQDVPIPHACCNKSLPKAAGNSTVLVCCLKRTVQTAKIQMICFNMHIYTTPFFAFLHAESTRKL